MDARIRIPVAGRRATGAEARRRVNAQTAPRVLVFINSYLPGFRGGGPTRSLANLVASAGSSLDFHVITDACDVGQARAYSGVSLRTWNQVGLARVRYLRRSASFAPTVSTLLRSVRPGVVYLNSAFHPRYTLIPWLLSLALLRRSAQIIVAPRGEFSPGALRIKPLRKGLLLRLLRWTCLASTARWHATTPLEAEDIRRAVGGDVRPVVAPNIATDPVTAGVRSVKTPGVVKVLFLSRVSRKKNLLGALEIVSRVRGRVLFTVYGPLEDPDYWDECQEAWTRLPSSVTAHYGGAVPQESVFSAYRSHDVLLFPTHGENFGHVIFEALSCGCPVLLSDQTPWSDVEEAGAGWAFPLKETARFVETLEKMMSWSEEEHARWARGAVEYAQRAHRRDGVVDAYLRLFSPGRAHVGAV